MNAPKLTGARCQCPSCGLLFTSVREFDRHRTGTYAKPGEFAGHRRCLSLAQLLAKRWQMDERGYLRQGRREHAPAGLEARIPPQGATTLAGCPDGD